MMFNSDVCHIKGSDLPELHLKNCLKFVFKCDTYTQCGNFITTVRKRTEPNRIY